MFSCLECGREGLSSNGGTCPTCGGAVVFQATVDPLVGTELDGGYRVVEPLGEGGMSTVYRGLHPTFERDVAIKVLRRSIRSNATAYSRFLREAKIAATFESPHNVRVHDVGRCEDVPFLVMELVDGVSLVKLECPLPVERALGILCQVCEALEEAHAHGLVHRDLKPDNIMVSELAGRDHARVLDYGVAKLTRGATTLTEDGAIPGTPQYISPEQGAGRTVDHRADIYALGVILYELVTGRRPFEAATRIALIQKHLYEQPPRPSARAQISDQLEALILACLAKRPEERPQSARDLRGLLEGVRGLEESGAKVGGGSPRADRVESTVPPLPTDTPPG